MDKALILNKIIDKLFDGSKSKFARKLGVTPQTISSWLARNTFDIDLVYAKCEILAADWLLTGTGAMFKTAAPSVPSDETPNATAAAIISTLKDIIKEQSLQIARLEIELERQKSINGV